MELIPLLDEGGKGSRNSSEKANEAGVVLDEAMTGRLVDMQHGLVNLQQDIQGLTTGAFAPFISVVNGAVAILTDLAHGVDGIGHGRRRPQICSAALRMVSETSSSSSARQSDRRRTFSSPARRLRIG